MVDRTTEIVLIDSDGSQRKLEGQERKDWLNRTYSLAELLEFLQEYKTEGRIVSECDEGKLWTTIEGLLGTIKIFAEREAERNIAKISEAGF